MWDIRAVDVVTVLPIRHAVLWPHMPLDYCRVPEDDEGEHFACFVADEPVCVASLFADGAASVRLRKFATLPALQGQGIGSAMLAHLLESLSGRGIRHFWCDARCSAIGLYARFGLRPEAEPVMRNGIAFVRMGVEFTA